MTIEILFRLSGITLFLGGFLSSVGWVLFSILDPAHLEYEHSRWLPLNALIISGGFLITLGLTGFFLQYAFDAGIVGLVGYLLLFTGITVPYLAVHSIETVTMPEVPKSMMKFVSVGAPSLFLGLLISGIAVLRSDVYPLSLGAALILAPLVGLLTVIPGVPPWLGRNLASIPATATLAWAGMLTLLI